MQCREFYSRIRPHWKRTNSRPQKNGRHFVTTPIEELLNVNQKLAATLARQSLPKCHPDVFTGDLTLFHPWKSAFRAMIQHADISPAQEISYLRNYTRSEPLKVINNYRQRQYLNPTVALLEVWTELERRFGNPAAITNVLLIRLRKAAKFGEGDNNTVNLTSFEALVALTTSAR